jgi:PhzF family phenazine biosynthesis protein
MKRRFSQLDVFSHIALMGNPLAVVIDGAGLSDAEMQRFANWTNLSETTFLLAPEHSKADYRVRIFTASMELPFAGHPTLGSCQAWLASGGIAKQADYVVQECAAGLIRIQRTENCFAFEAPPLLRSGPVTERDITGIAAMLGLNRDEIVDCNWIANGPGWVGVLLRDDTAVLDVKISPGEYKIGIIGPSTNPTCAYEVRAFFPFDGGVEEDPVTGSLNAGLAQWLIGAGIAKPPYVVKQGTVRSRDGRICISVDDRGAVWVGGSVISCIDGTVDL